MLLRFGPGVFAAIGRFFSSQPIWHLGPWKASTIRYGTTDRRIQDNEQKTAQTPNPKTLLVVLCRFPGCPYLIVIASRRTANRALSCFRPRASDTRNNSRRCDSEACLGARKTSWKVN